MCRDLSTSFNIKLDKILRGTELLDATAPIKSDILNQAELEMRGA